MQILHVIPSVAMSDGGPPRALAAMESALTAGGVTVATATTDHGLQRPGPRSEEIALPNGRVCRFYSRKWTNFYKVAPGMVPWLWRNVRSFDAVHIHAVFSFSSLAAGLIASVRGVPYIVRPLGTLTRYGMTRRAPLKRLSLALLEAPLLRRAAAVHFTSEDEKIEAQALKISMRSVVIPLGVEIDGAGAPGHFDEAFSGARGKLAILFLSRLDPKKNIEALLDAFALIPDSGTSPVLIIAGAGTADYTAQLKSRAASLGIAERVIWTGHLDGRRKADALARADIFVLPSLSENFGIAAVEAMLAALPCVLGEGVAVAGPAKSERAAIVVKPNPPDIAAAICTLANDESLRRQMGQKAQAHASDRYSMQRMAQALKVLYSEVSFPNRKARQ